MERRVDVGDVVLHVREEGDGRPVLLLHGFPDSSDLWRGQIPALAEAGFRTITPDLRGFGESDKPAKVRAYAMPRIRRDLRNLLETHGVERADVIGHDWGAAAAWALAGWEPDLVRTLTVISLGHPRGFLTSNPLQVLESWYAVFFQIPRISEALIRWRWGLFRRFLSQSPDIDQSIEDLKRPGALTAALNWYRGSGRPDMLFRYPRVGVPTLGIHGHGDRYLTRAQMKASHRYVDGPWRFEAIDGGHWLPLTNPRDLNQLLLAFLESA